MKKMLQRFAPIVLVLFGLAAFCSCVTPTKYPTISLTQTQIVNPGYKALPPEITAFYGKWEGIWQFLSSESSGLKVIFIVEDIAARYARVLYSWEGSFSFSLSPGKVRHTGIFSQNEKGETLLSWTTREGARFTFKINEDGDLEGVTDSPSCFITMRQLSR